MRIDERIDITRRNYVRQELINALTRSTGNVKTAEYCVNNLTVHNPQLLAEAAVVFASEFLPRVDAEGGAQ